MPAGCPVHDRAVEVLKPFNPVIVTGTVIELESPGGACGIVIAPVPKLTLKSRTFVVVLLELFAGIASDWSAEAVNVISCEGINPGVTLMVNGALAPNASVPALHTTLVVPVQFGPLPAATNVYPAGTL